MFHNRPNLHNSSITKTFPSMCRAMYEREEGKISGSGEWGEGNSNFAKVVMVVCLVGTVDQGFTTND